MTKDIRYIIKRVIIGVLIILVMSFINSCEVHAETRNVSGNTKVSGYYVAPGNYWTVTSQNTRNVLLLYEDWTMAMAEEHYNFGYLDICSNIDLRVNNASADCSDGCIDNLAIVKLNRSCKIYTDTTPYIGTEYYMFYTIRDYKYKNADTLPYFQDYITLENWSNYNGFVQFTQSFLSDEDVYMLYASNGRIEELQEQTNQLIQSQSQTQHQDALNTQEAINDLNDSITDSSTASNQDFNDAINSVKNSLPTNSTISSLITMPITFLQKIIDALNGTCTPIIIGELYEYNMTMPCINPVDYIGIIWNIIDIICAGFFAYYFGKKLVLLFHNITSMKEGGLKEAYD